jgi:hypothetical protein
MIEISEIAIGHTTPWCIICIDKCGSPDLMVCDQCRGHIVTYHTCPDCNVVKHYYGYDMPEACKCGYIWPDLNLLKTELEDRIGYYSEP